MRNVAVDAILNFLIGLWTTRIKSHSGPDQVVLRTEPNCNVPGWMRWRNCSLRRCWPKATIVLEQDERPVE
jgi:hypothetical protein